ncbi:MAG: HNH endonuclease [Planctomycetota bacterium]|nr:HNH endonuclease [Planctomycetota bacterium]
MASKSQGRASREKPGRTTDPEGVGRHPLGADDLADILDVDPRAGALLAGPRGAGGLSAKVLVLNRLYMALRVISAKRAFAMLCRDLAEVIHVENGEYRSFDFASWAEVATARDHFSADHYDWVRTVRLDVPVPKVIRLLGYDRLPEQHVKLNRRNLFARDRNQCQYCGHFFPTSELSIDHVMPRAQGGGDTWENLVCSCVKCNARKGGRTPDQAHMTLIRRPLRPKRNPLIALRLGQQKYASWKAFLDNAYWSVELR